MVLSFLIGLVTGVAVAIALYALFSANDDDPSRGHPL